ncbi:hypothetical protein HOF65_00540 [bacterium]|nr:hypothetical protein [bacterium]MBT3852534.1 hypothetical protein [bacterium]MBT4632699.1 hypothetical protein [bacterium]MBT5491855.1 hypothetical protein [bacterium]MBT6778281.1 hypothetical protein [bacterium]
MYSIFISSQLYALYQKNHVIQIYTSDKSPLIGNINIHAIINLSITKAKNKAVQYFICFINTFDLVCSVKNKTTQPSGI